MRTIVKYLICFCAVLASVATLQVHCARGESELSLRSETVSCPTLTNLSLLHNDESFFRTLTWLGKEKTVRVHSAPVIEKRENEEEDDEVHSFSNRIGAACISSMFMGLATGDILSRTHVADCHLSHLLITGRYLVLQVIRI